MIPVTLTSTSLVVASMATIVLAIAFSDRRLSLAGLSAYFAIVGLSSVGALDWRIALLKLVTGQIICLILLFTSLRIHREIFMERSQVIDTYMPGDRAAILAPLSRTAVLIFSLALAYYLASTPIISDIRDGTYTVQAVAYGSLAGGLVALMLFRGMIKAGIGLILMVIGVNLLILSHRPAALLEFLAASTIVEVLLGLTVAYLDAHIALPHPTNQSSEAQMPETRILPD